MTPPVFRILLLLGPTAAAAGRAHEHGVAQLDIARDGNIVAVALHGAGDGFVGFEHAPESAAEQRQVNELVAALRAGERWFQFADADCRQTAVNVTPPLAAAAAERDHHEAHDAEHAHDDHGSHSTHADWHAEWTFSCAGGTPPTALNVQLFDVLPRLATVRVQYAAPEGQTSATLNPTSRSLALPSVP